MKSKTGFQHQCKLPPVWWSKLIGSKIGREWICSKCESTWRLTYDDMPYIPGAPSFTEWRIKK